MIFRNLFALTQQRISLCLRLFFLFLKSASPDATLPFRHFGSYVVPLVLTLEITSTQWRTTIKHRYAGIQITPNHYRLAQKA